MSLGQEPKAGWDPPGAKRPISSHTWFFLSMKQKAKLMIVNELLSLFCLYCELPPGSDFANPIFVVFHLEKFKLKTF